MWIFVFWGKITACCNFAPDPRGFVPRGWVTWCFLLIKRNTLVPPHKRICPSRCKWLGGNVPLESEDKSPGDRRQEKDLSPCLNRFNKRDSTGTSAAIDLMTHSRHTVVYSLQILIAFFSWLIFFSKEKKSLIFFFTSFKKIFIYNIICLKIFFKYFKYISLHFD